MDDSWGIPYLQLALDDESSEELPLVDTQSTQDEDIDMPSPEQRPTSVASASTEASSSSPSRPATPQPPISRPTYVPRSRAGLSNTDIINYLRELTADCSFDIITELENEGSEAWRNYRQVAEVLQVGVARFQFKPNIARGTSGIIGMGTATTANGFSFRFPLALLGEVAGVKQKTFADRITTWNRVEQLLHYCKQEREAQRSVSGQAEEFVRIMRYYKTPPLDPTSVREYNWGCNIRQLLRAMNEAM